MARKKAVKKYTLSEFKAWLEGIEEIQPDDWHPDLNQWKMIRDKLGAIVELEPKVLQHIPPDPMHRQVVTEQPFRQPQSAFQVTGDTITSGTADMDISPAAKALLNGGKLPNNTAIDPAQGSNTPIVDTKDGNYESSFT